MKKSLLFMFMLVTCHSLFASELAPEDPERYIQLTAQYQKQGDWMKGLASAKKALSLAPDSARAHFYYGVLLHDQGLTEDAVKSFHRTLELDPHFKGVQGYLGKSHGELGDVAKEIEYYRSALGEGGDKAEILLNLGNAYERKEEYESARTTYEELIEMDPSNALAYFHLGRLYEKEDKVKKAIEYFEKSLKHEELHKTYRALKPLVTLDPRYKEIAFRVYQKLLEYEPAEPDHHVQLGYLYQRDKHFDEAEASYAAALELEPEYSVAYYNLGVLYQGRKEWKKAADHYLKAIEFNDSDADYYASLSVVYCEMGDAKAAHEILSQGQQHRLDDYRRTEIGHFLNEACPLEVPPQT